MIALLLTGPGLYSQGDTHVHFFDITFFITLLNITHTIHPMILCVRADCWTNYEHIGTEYEQILSRPAYVTVRNI